MNKSTIWKNYRFPIILLSGIAIGAVLGIVLGEKAKVLAPLQQPGRQVRETFRHLLQNAV